MKSPQSWLQDRIKQKVVVYLKNGMNYTGRLLQQDSYMSLVLEDCLEIDREGNTTRLDKALLRGNNILLVILEE
ncbi:MAG: LSM domain-containing protein [Promethearchaeota archaeon]